MRVKLVDSGGRTVCVFRRETAHPSMAAGAGAVNWIAGMVGRGPYWMVVPKPSSRRRIRQIEANGPLIPEPFRRTDYPVTFDDQGMPARLYVPGVVDLQWEKVIAVLDGLVDEYGPEVEVTVGQFRSRVGT